MKRKAWEADIDTWSRLNDTVWYWEMILGAQAIIIACEREYKSEALAFRAARRTLKRLGLVEKKT